MDTHIKLTLHIACEFQNSKKRYLAWKASRALSTI